MGNLIKAVALNALAGQTLKSFTAPQMSQCLNAGQALHATSMAGYSQRNAARAVIAAARVIARDNAPAAYSARSREPGSVPGAHVTPRSRAGGRLPGGSTPVAAA